MKLKFIVLSLLVLSMIVYGGSNSPINENTAKSAGIGALLGALVTKDGKGALVGAGVGALVGFGTKKEIVKKPVAKKVTKKKTTQKKKVKTARKKVKSPEIKRTPTKSEKVAKTSVNETKKVTEQKVITHAPVEPIAKAPEPKPVIEAPKAEIKTEKNFW